MKESISRIFLGSRNDKNSNYASGNNLALGINGSTTPSVLKGLVGSYQPQSYRPGPNLGYPGGAQWLDLSGAGNHAEVYGSPTVNSISNAFGATGSFTCLTGTVNDQIVWPATVLPANYTLFYVARYNTNNSSTAATVKSSNDGSSTTGFSVPFGNPITSTGGEVRVTYNASNADSIWVGIQGLLSSAFLTANKRYIISGEMRTTNDLANGNQVLINEWDSRANMDFIYPYFQTNVNNKASLSRKFFTSVFNLYTGFSVGNGWQRGRYEAPSIFSSSSYAYFRNYAIYEVEQNDLHQIFTGYDTSWYSGFFAGNAGASYQGNTLTTANTHSNNWVLGTSSNATDTGTQLFRTNKVQRYNSTPSNPGSTYARLSVNPIPAIASNYQIAEVVVYDRGLSSSEITSVESYLGTKYGI